MKKPFLQTIAVFLDTKKIPILIILTIVYWIIAIVYSFYLGDNLRYPDEKIYFNEYGQNITNLHIFSSDGITSTAFHPPLYPILLSLIIKLGMGVIGARLINYFALFLTIIVVYRILEKQKYKYSPVISSLLILIYVVLFYTAGTLYPQTVGSLFLIFAIFFYWNSHSSIKSSILCGVFLGLSILTITTLIFVLPFMILYTVLSRKNYFKGLVLLACCSLLIIAPWTIRNYVKFNRLVFVSSNFGTNFLIGNSPSTTPRNGPAAAVGLEGVFEEADRLGLDEFEKNIFYTQTAMDYIKNEPVHYGLLYFQKVVNYFNYRNDLVTRSESSSGKDLYMLVTYGSLILIALLRLISSKRNPLSKFESFSLSLYLCSAFISAVVFTRIRYRLPFDYLLILLAAISIERFLQIRSERKLSPRN